ncbi:hypothetical protein [Enterococcus faecium]|uniref:hypothetical protein n=1 Tax=Enterococcus faecium TaxID=1352 RepID=UPI001CF470C4|nr:hypothetical protein [Enterococcus faecium]MCA6771014.1 hypothetical protein [Enterococcus faecium]
MFKQIKSKGFDAFATFLGSLIALYLYDKFSPVLLSLCNFLNLTEDTTGKIESMVFSLLVAIGFIVILSIWITIKWFLSNFSSPKIQVSFFNQKNKVINELDMKDEIEEPHYLKICFNAKFSRFQLWFIKKILKANLVITLNPQMCSIELAEGFLANSEDFYLKNQSLYFDIFSKYKASKVSTTVYIELSLLLVLPAKGEVKMELDLSRTNCVFKYLFMNYCKFNMSKLSIEG